MLVKKKFIKTYQVLLCPCAGWRFEMPTARDPRWILFVETGEYSNLSRYREPDADDIAAAERALAQAARSGWLAVMSHSVYEATFQRRLKDGRGDNVAE